MEAKQMQDVKPPVSSTSPRLAVQNGTSSVEQLQVRGQQSILKMGSLKPEMLEELQRILRIMQSLNISKGNPDASTENQNESEVTIKLASPPSQAVDQNLEQSLDVFKGYFEGEPKFRRLLEKDGLFATKVSGIGLDCFIYSLLQHAKKQYNTSQFKLALVNQIKTKAGLSKKTEMRYNDTPEALGILKAVNEICVVNLEVYFIQINPEGQPIILPPLVDETLKSARQPVVIWQQPGHYVAIASKKLEQLCGLYLSESKEEQEEIKVEAEPTNSESLPQILYDRQVLQKIIDELSLSPEVAVKVTAYIDNIEHQVSEIKNYQSKENLQNFYESIRTAVLEIQNIADSIYELVKVYHPKLSYTLKQQIIQWTKSLEIALKHSTLSATERSTLALKTKYLYAEQSLVSRDALVRETFMRHLEKLKAILLDPNKPLPCCYIAYVWSSQEQSEEEYWVQPFLHILYDHLTIIGIRVVMDIRDNKPGDSLYPFTKQYQDGNYVILIGTESLLQKHYSAVPNILQTQLNTLLQKIKQDQQQFGESRLYSLLISGTLKTTYPEYYHQYSTAKDARDMGYLGILRALIDWIYQSRLEAIRQPYLELWRTFMTTYPSLAETSDAIREELAFSYHQKYLSCLTQSTQYQSVAAQESIQYIQATELRMIDTLRESQGTNLKTLFDGHGQQFQRPNLNVDFIERSDFDMPNSFAQQSQQYLILQGAEGVGKTELAKYYFLHPAKPYILRAWFQASSKQQLEHQYIELATSRGIQFIPGMSIEEKSKRVRQWLEQQDCLLVYDNIQDTQTLEDLLPKQGEHHIVVTARTPLNWPEHCQVLSIKTLKASEAIALICRITGYSPEQFFLKELVHHLELLPVKLIQAGNYMKAKSVNSYQYWLRYQRYHEYLNAIPQYLETDLQQGSTLMAEIPELVKAVDEIANLESLPELSYDRKVLEEMVANLSMPQRITERVTICFNHIEQRISNIRQYQATKNLESFYQSILATLQEIRNIVNEIYTLIEFYHPNFPNLIRARIIERIVPLETETQKRLKTKEREQNAFYSKRLCAEQSFVSRQSTLMPHLKKLKLLFAKQDKPIRCYICYAWPSSNAEEYWIQPFLSTLYDHLKAVGITVLMDIRDVKLGESAYEFMKQYQSEDYLILVGTESLLQKHHLLSPHPLQTALNIALNRSGINQMQWDESRIYPMLISGTLKTAYPERYYLYSRVQDAREAGYLGTLKQLIEWMYGQSLEPIQTEINPFWRMLFDTYSGLPQELSAVETELTLGYHQQYLERLKQDTSYQSIEVQEKTPHSSAVQAEMISTWMRFKGGNPQPLLNESGQQFQRPYSNPDFIERPKLWEKMVQHFVAAENQMLTLTAHGLGGMGKTELAGHYYLHPPKAYALRAWFDANSKESLSLQYIDLAESNGVQFAKDTPIKEKIARAKKWLEEKKDCLLIYDNVPNAESLTEWLPRRGKHHILITSRNAVDWPTHQKLDVDVMEEQEAIALICKVTGCNPNEPQLKELVHALGLLPLALAQAAAYIKVKDKLISAYLSEYQKSQSSLETSNINPKHEPVWVTFNMNLISLQQECPAALMTLKQASWLGYRAIPEVLLFLMTDNTDARPKELLWDDIKEHIRRYSLMQINVEALQLNIHPLLQDIIRSKQMPEEQLQQFRKCSKALDALEEPYYQSNLTNYRVLLSHAECLRTRAKAVTINVTDDKTRDFLLIEPTCLRMFYLRLSLNQAALTFLAEVVSTHERHYGKDHLETATILGSLGKVYLHQGKFEQAREYTERALRIQEHYYGKDHVEMARWLGNLGEVYRQQGKLEQAREYTERALRIQEHYYGKDHVEMALWLGNLGAIYLGQGKLEQAKEHYERALEIKGRHYGKDHVEVALWLGNLGTVYGMQGKLEQAREYIEQAFRIEEHHYGKDHVEAAKWLGNLGEVYRHQGKLEQAREHYERVLRIQEHHYGKEHVRTAAVLGNLGIVYSQQGKLEQARELYGQALRIKERHYGKDHVETAPWLGNLGTVYFQQGKLEQARELYGQALRIKERHYGKDHVETETELGNLSEVYRQQGELEQARKYIEQTLRIQEHHYGKDHVGTATSLGNLGEVYRQQGKLEQAREYIERALGIQECHYGKDHVETATSLGYLGEVYRQQGKLEQAREHIERALRIQEHHYGKDHVETATSLGNLGTVYRQQGKFEQARAYTERALRIKESHYGKDHVEMAAVLGNLGTVYFQQGRLEEAKEYYERMLKIKGYHYGKDHLEMAAVLGNLGTVYFQQGRLEEAKEYYERALKIKGYHYSKDHVETATELGNLGNVYFQQSKLKEANEHYEQALRIKERHYGKDHIETAPWLGNLGNVCRDQGKFEQASEYVERALRIKERYYGKDHIETALLLGNLGNIYRDQGKLAQARKHYERALMIKERHYGKNHLGIADILFHLATNNIELNLLTVAQSQLQRARVIYRQYFRAGHPNLTKIDQCLQRLSSVFLDPALAANQKSKPMTEGISITSLKSDIHQFNQQGMKYYRAQEYKEAIEFFQQALSLQQKITSPSHEEIATLYFNIGSACLLQKDYLSAKTALQSAYDMRLTLFGTSHSATQKAQNRLQECQRAIEQHPSLTEDKTMSENKTDHPNTTEPPVRSMVFSTVGGAPNNPEIQPQNTSANTNKPNPKPSPFKEALKSTEAVKSAALPPIPYNQEELQELIDALQEKVHDPEKSAQLSTYIEEIHQKVLKIKRYQSKQDPVLFYQAINTALLEIKNTANAIYELAKFFDQTLTNTVKRKILEWIKPLEEALAKHLEMPTDVRDELAIKTRHLYAEQSFVSRQPALQQALMYHLREIKALLLEVGKSAPRCYISYAWPSRENKEQEYWIQPFLYILYDHLTAAGIRVVMDIRDNKPGDSIYRFMEQYHDGNYIILIGTESLLEKHRSEGGVHAAYTELSIIENRFKQDQEQLGQSRIYPMLISGTINSAYPEIYNKYYTVRDARNYGYLGTLKKLIDWFYEQRLASGNQQYADLWKGFFTSMPSLLKDAGAVEQELALGYHRQRLDNLRQNIQVQAVKSESLVVQSGSVLESRDASSFVTPPVQTTQLLGDMRENLVNSNHSVTRNEIQRGAEEDGSRLLTQIPGNSVHMQRTYCPYFSRTAVIGFSVLAVGLALEAGRRYYSKF